MPLKKTAEKLTAFRALPSDSTRTQSGNDASIAEVLQLRC
jgi:hypothetical protein